MVEKTGFNFPSHGTKSNLFTWRADWRLHPIDLFLSINNDKQWWPLLNRHFLFVWLAVNCKAILHVFLDNWNKKWKLKSNGVMMSYWEELECAPFHLTHEGFKWFLVKGEENRLALMSIGIHLVHCNKKNTYSKFAVLFFSINLLPKLFLR